MSKMQQGGSNGFTAESGEFGPQSGSMPDQSMPEGNMPEGNMPNGQMGESMPGGQTDGSGQDMPQNMTPSSPPSGGNDSSGFGQGGDDSSGFGQSGMPSFGYGDNSMPSGGPGGFEGGQDRDMDAKWLGDDPEKTLSSICKNDGIPSDGEALTDISALDGLWKAVKYDSATSDDISYYKADISVDGNDMTLDISDPGQNTDSSGTDITGDCTGTASEKDGKLSATLKYDQDNAKIIFSNIYTLDGLDYIAGIYSDDSTEKDVYVVLLRPGQN